MVYYFRIMGKLFLYLSLLVVVFTSCNNHQTASVPLKRTTVNKNPVKEYAEKVPDSLNDWYFKVQLFETDSTFNYTVKMQYKEVTGEQLIRLPNFGYMPKPELKKGAYDKTVMVGFLDDKGNFMNYKMVYVADEQMGIRSIKRYTVSQ